MTAAAVAHSSDISPARDPGSICPPFGGIVSQPSWSCETRMLVCALACSDIVVSRSAVRLSLDGRASQCSSSRLPDGDDDAELCGRALIADRIADEVGWPRQFP